MKVQRANSFWGNTRGNTAIMFSLAAVPMMLGAGAAVDMIRADNVRTTLQAAADSAAIAGATSGKFESADLTLVVDEYLKANGVVDAMATVKNVRHVMDKTKRTFSVSVEGGMKTSFMFLAGVTEMDILAKAEVSLGGNGLEVVLALDNTESMNAGGRLPALKTAAKSLVDTVLEASSGGAYVKIGIVPFSNYVNVGVANKSKSWIDVKNDYSKTVTTYSYPDATKTNCRIETWSGTSDGVPYTTTGEVCDWDYGTAVEGTGTRAFAWGGCVGSRSSPDDAKISDLSNKYTGLVEDRSGEWNVGCAAEILPLTSDKTELNAKIDALYGSGNTYIAPGVLWGWNMLDSAEPIIGAKTKDWMKTNKGIKALVVMTDGDNTLSPHPDNTLYHDGYDAVLANAKTADVCKATKKDDIVIYTVAFMVTDPTAKDMLKKCASDASKAFTADDPASLDAAFKDIANALLTIRLTQ